MNQIYRISEADLKHKLNSLDPNVKVIEFDGEEIDDLDTFLAQCIQKFKLSASIAEENYDSPDPLHGLSYAFRDLSNVSDFPQQPIMMVIHAQGFLGRELFNDIGIVWGMFVNSVFPYYDMDQEYKGTDFVKTPKELRRPFNLYLIK